MSVKIRNLFITIVLLLFFVIPSCEKDSDNLIGPSEDGYIISGSFEIASAEKSEPLPESSPVPVYSISLSTYEDWGRKIEGEIDSNGHFSIFISTMDFLYRFTVQFNLPDAGHVNMEVRDAHGNMVKKKLIDDFMSAGKYWVLVDLSDRINIDYISDEIRSFADKYWHYVDTVDSKGESLNYNYWKWLKYHFMEAGVYPENNIDPDNFAVIDSLLNDYSFYHYYYTYSNIGFSPHHLPSTKTPLYYVMIGKYSQFIYGWQDIDDLDESGNTINPSIRGYLNFSEDIHNIKSPLRNNYLELLNKASQGKHKY